MIKMLKLKTVIMKKNKQFNLKELSYQESLSINGGTQSPFWENFGKSIGLLYGWGVNACGAALAYIGNALSSKDPHAVEMMNMNQLTLFQ
jgi:hypothetical protein